jgi:hypothetical protein
MTNFNQKINEAKQTLGEQTQKFENKVKGF